MFALAQIGNGLFWHPDCSSASLHGTGGEGKASHVLLMALQVHLACFFLASILVGGSLESRQR